MYIAIVEKQDDELVEVNDEDIPLHRLEKLAQQADSIAEELRARLEQSEMEDNNRNLRR